jgi:hypothetical protein
MSYGKADKPCASYRPWKGEEPLCGNCGWEQREHPDQRIGKPGDTPTFTDGNSVAPSSE